MDHEILDFIFSSDPEVVAIDAPLSLPKPGQALRSCDRKLVEMGIHVFPPTLIGMKILAERAIKLKEKLEESGYCVIEVYPGGTQDLLGIPRKSRGTILLKEGLISIGVKGLRCDESGHELDAVTCSLTGIAYIKKMYIEVGDPDECIVILPRLEMFLKKD
jgi:predicted nuclease with RNAse H fold